MAKQPVWRNPRWKPSLRFWKKNKQKQNIETYIHSIWYIPAWFVDHYKSISFSLSLSLRHHPSEISNQAEEEPKKQYISIKWLQKWQMDYIINEVLYFGDLYMFSFCISSWVINQNVFACMVVSVCVCVSVCFASLSPVVVKSSTSFLWSRITSTPRSFRTISSSKGWKTSRGGGGFPPGEALACWKGLTAIQNDAAIWHGCIMLYSIWYSGQGGGRRALIHSRGDWQRDKHYSSHLKVSLCSKRVSLSSPATGLFHHLFQISNCVVRLHFQGAGLATHQFHADVHGHCAEGLDSTSQLEQKHLYPKNS